MIRRYGLVLVSLLGLLFVYADVQRIDDEIASGEFQRAAMAAEAAKP